MEGEPIHLQKRRGLNAIVVEICLQMHRHLVHTGLGGDRAGCRVTGANLNNGTESMKVNGQQYSRAAADVTSFSPLGLVRTLKKQL